MVGDKQIVKDYPLYSVDTSGRVFNNNTGKELTTSLDKDGYEVVTLYNHGRKKTKKVHRLVAEAFIENPRGALEVNHKNMIRNDNKVENLEWVTCLENQRYKYEVGKYQPGPSKRRAKTQCIETGEEFESQTSAARSVGVAQGSISSSILRGYRVGGYHWRTING